VDRDRAGSGRSFRARGVACAHGLERDLVLDRRAGRSNRVAGALVTVFGLRL
jgi:hypothetical protein